MVPPRVFTPPPPPLKKSWYILNRMVGNCAHIQPALFFSVTENEFSHERRKLHELKCYCCVTLNSWIITVSKAFESKHLQQLYTWFREFTQSRQSLTQVTPFQPKITRVRINNIIISFGRGKNVVKHARFKVFTAVRIYFLSDEF